MTHPLDQYPPQPANFVPLSPTSFIQRAAHVHPEHCALIHGSLRRNWKQVYDRSVKLAHALNKRGIARNNVVSILSPNTPQLIECHYAIPMSGAVINTLNIRLEAQTIAYIIDHSECEVLMVDTQFSVLAAQALALSGREDILLVDMADPEYLDAGEMLGIDYEILLAEGDASYAWPGVEDEWQALSLNYTSGTSGKPKGVIYHHRGAYLMSMGIVPGWKMVGQPVYLYTVPLFHCCGWGHVWTMALLAGTMVCCRQLSAEMIFKTIDEHKVTHFGGAPVVLSMLVNAPEQVQRRFDVPVQLMTAGAPPPAAILEATEKLGFNVMQVYGLTETYGHTVHCDWHAKWDDLSFEKRAQYKARQGVKMPITESLQVLDMTSGNPVPADGQTRGEICIRANTMMKGYFKDAQASDEAFEGGVLHSGDVAVVYPNGYIQVKDRLKDIIISGGENISSVEVESVLHRHPAVALAAVVAQADERWGEVPCAFVELKPDGQATEEELIEFCRQQMSGFKRPQRVVFQELPKTATGKVQKFMLREQLAD